MRRSRSSCSCSREYVDSVVGALRDNLEHTWIVDEHGNKRKLTPQGTRGRKERK